MFWSPKDECAVCAPAPCLFRDYKTRRGWLSVAEFSIFLIQAKILELQQALRHGDARAIALFNHASSGAILNLRTDPK
jgi:hypothetical protein